MRHSGLLVGLVWRATLHALHWPLIRSFVHLPQWHYWFWMASILVCNTHCVMARYFFQPKHTHAYVTYKRADAPVMGHLWEYAIVGGDAMADA